MGKSLPLGWKLDGRTLTLDVNMTAPYMVQVQLCFGWLDVTWTLASTLTPLRGDMVALQTDTAAPRRLSRIRWFPVVSYARCFLQGVVEYLILCSYS